MSAVLGRRTGRLTRDRPSPFAGPSGIGVLTERNTDHNGVRTGPSDRKDAVIVDLKGTIGPKRPEIIHGHGDERQVIRGQRLHERYVHTRFRGRTLTPAGHTPAAPHSLVVTVLPFGSRIRKPKDANHWRSTGSR